ncbi:MAG: DUF4160 domain-containing protein [Sulfuricella sp.]|nr:DUF4160 domain-containing protein [Sulfuricella sp.]
MPVLLRLKGYSFFFFSNEGIPPEAPHIHVRRGAARAKFWLVPEVALASSFDLNGPELNELARMVMENREFFERKWHEHIGKIS